MKAGRLLQGADRCLVEVRNYSAPSRALRSSVAAAQAAGTKSMKPRSTSAVPSRTFNC